MYKIQTAFMAGELSPSMYGRIDDAKYQHGLAKCRNFIPLPQGPLVNRPGLRYVRDAKFNKPTRLIPFQFSSTQTMVIELGDKYARFITNGKTLLNESGHDPYEITTPYAADELNEIRYVQAGDVMTLVHVEHPPMELRRYGPIDWRLVPVSFGLDREAPKNVSATFSVVAKPNYDLKDAEKLRYTYKYKVTSVYDNEVGGSARAESYASDEASVKGNLYLDNALVDITWDAVPGAKYYRVYKSNKGVFGFIGETTDTKFSDDNFKGDHEYTPPIYDDPFSVSKGITKIDVTDGGEGYQVGGAVGFNLERHEEKRDKFKTFSTSELGTKVGGFIHLYSNTKTSRKMGILTGGEDNKIRYKLDQTESKKLELKKSTELIKVVDKAGKGKGAVIETTYYTYTFSSVWSLSRVFEWGISIVNVAFLDQGNGYERPELAFGNITESIVTATYGDGEGHIDETRTPVYSSNFSNTDLNKQLPIKIDNSVTPHLLITDSTGVGARATPVIENGRVSRVVVTQGGIRYTNPTITLKGVNRPTREATFKATMGQAGDYPGSVAYFEQRRVFGGTPNRPQTIWMTRSGTDSDMTFTLPTRDDNRIKFRISAQEASRIQHVVPLNKLIVLTTGTEFRVTSVNSDAITPSSISVSPQSYVGASHVQPVLVNASMIYAAARGGHIRELGYNWQANGYITEDLSLRSAHLFTSTRPVSLALQKAPEQIVWVAMSDGRLLGLTYLPDQAVGGWCVHDTQGGRFESITCVTEGEEDILYAVVKRELRGTMVRTIERMSEWHHSTLQDAFYVDCGATYTGKPSTRIEGLTWLEGEEVAILADGAVLARQVVKDAAVDLPAPASVVHIGLPIEADIKTLPVAYAANDGSYGQGKKKNVGDVWVRVYESSSFKVGPDFNNLIEAKIRKAEPMGSPPTLQSDEIQVYPKTKWGASGQVCIRQDKPLPLSIVNITWRLME